jgi:hypothetical protein
MKKVLLLLTTLFVIRSYSQDSSRLSQTYISIQPAFYTASTGGGGLGPSSQAQRTTFDVEIGRQWDALSLGLDIGKTTLEKQGKYDDIDENGSLVFPSGKWYLEAKPSLNVFRQGKITNTLTIGVGYVFNSNQPMMNELTTGVEYDANPSWSYNINVGTCYFTGNRGSTNQTFFGFSVVYLFKNKHKS